MSRTHCARSFPTKLSISEPLDFFIVSVLFGVSVSRLLPLHSFFFFPFLRFFFSWFFCWCFPYCFCCCRGTHELRSNVNIFSTVIFIVYYSRRECVTTTIAQEVLHAKGVSILFFFPPPNVVYKQPFNFVYSISNCIVYAAVLPIMDPLSLSIW